ncbi:MAG: TIR domain-containing protein [Candidatus Doudnabacteria bacterium]
MATVSNVWQPEFMQGRFFRLFVSHTSAHRQAVGALRAALLPHGVLAFVAHDAIQPTQEWLDVIVRALREAEALAAYLTGDFHDSPWTDQEVGAAVGRELLVLPLKVDQDPYGFIGRSRSPNCRDPSNPRANEATDGRGCRRPVRALRWMEQRTGESEAAQGATGGRLGTVACRGREVGDLQQHGNPDSGRWIWPEHGRRRGAQTHRLASRALGWAKSRCCKRRGDEAWLAARASE